MQENHCLPENFPSASRRRESRNSQRRTIESGGAVCRALDRFDNCFTRIHTARANFFFSVADPRGRSNRFTREIHNRVRTVNIVAPTLRRFAVPLHQLTDWRQLDLFPGNVWEQ